MKVTNKNVSPSVAKYLDKTDAERIEFLRRDMWIDYPLATKILAKMEALHNEPQTDRKLGMLLYGNSNNGKTAILKRFCKLHQSGEYEDENGSLVNCTPVVYCLAPPAPDESRMYGEILSAIGVPYGHAEQTSKKLESVKYYLKLLKTKTLIIDEMHNILTGSFSRRGQFLEALKSLTIHTSIPFILAGTNDALSAVSIDVQKKSRFRPKELPTWSNDETFAIFIATLESLLPLKCASNLYFDKKLLAKIHDMSKGCIGEAVLILKDAADYAITSGSEKITRKEIAESMW